MGQGATLAQWTNPGDTIALKHFDSQKSFNNVDGTGDTVYAVGTNRQVAKSTDAGVTWVSVDSGADEGEDLIGVAVADVSTVWAVGQSGLIRYSTNGGTSWSTQVSGTAMDLKEIDAASTSVAWAVGNGGTILKTVNGGTNWSTQVSGTELDLRAVHVIDENTAVTVGTGATILKTTNGGTTWNALDGQTSEDLEAVYFVDANTGWVGGDRGTIRKTTDGGSTWTIQAAGIDSDWDLWDIQCTDSQTCFVGTGNGVILHTIDGGSNWTNVEDSMGILPLYAKDFETVVAMSQGTLGATRYTPTYSTTSTIVSNNLHTDTTRSVQNTTLTATQTLNGGTITYYVANSDPAGVSCGSSTPWLATTSGSATSFGSTSQTKLYWCAQLTSPSTSTSPRLTGITLSYETAIVGHGGGGGGDGGGGGGGGGCTSNCTPGPQAPTALPPTVSSSTSVQWNFSPSTLATEYILSQDNGNGTSQPLLAVQDPNIGSITEKGRTPNTRYVDRVIQAKNSAGSSPTTALPAATTLSETPVALELDPTSTASSSAILLSRGNNPDITEFAIGERDQGFVQASGAFNQNAADAQWIAWSKWGQPATKPDGSASSTVRAIPMSQFLPNREYRLTALSRNLDHIQATASPEAILVSPIEAVARLTATEPQVGTLIVTAFSSAPSGEFSNRAISNSGLLFELESDAIPSKNSGWIHDASWTAHDIPKGTYLLRVRSRNQQGRETTPVTTNVILSGVVTSPEKEKDTVLPKVEKPTLLPLAPPTILWPGKDQERIHSHDIPIVGTAPAQTTVELTVDGRQEKITTRSDGSWSTLESLNDGTYLLSVATVNAAGVRSTVVTSRTIIVDTQTPPPDVAPLPPTITSPTDPYQSSSPTVNIRGRGPANTIILVRWQQPKGTTIAKDAVPVVDGAWSATRTLTPGTYTLTAVATVPSGSSSSESAPVTVRLAPTEEPVSVKEQEQAPPRTKTAAITKTTRVPVEDSDQNTNTPEIFNPGSHSRLSGEESVPELPKEPTLLSTPAQALKNARLVQLSFGGTTMDSNSTQLPTILIPVDTTVMELSGQAQELNAQVVVTLYSDPVSTTTTSDSTGRWSTTLDLSTKEQDVRHTLTVKTTDSQGQASETILAYLTIASAAAVTTTEPPSPATTTIQAVTQTLQETVVAPTKKAVVATVKTAKKAAIATHQTIVQVEPQTQATLAAVLPTVALVNPPVVATIPQLPVILSHAFTWILGFLGL
ncbi:hypothetical protein HZA86_01050, partial [Candidatus Uhrbacteria bacterium]|nr:hypothetical protein [Candidatus Uhrbacteria bacterium]